MSHFGLNETDLDNFEEKGLQETEERKQKEEEQKQQEKQEIDKRGREEQQQLKGLWSRAPISLVSPKEHAKRRRIQQHIMKQEQDRYDEFVRTVALKKVSSTIQANAQAGV